MSPNHSCLAYRTFLYKNPPRAEVGCRSPFREGAGVGVAGAPTRTKGSSKGKQ